MKKKIMGIYIVMLLIAATVPGLSMVNDVRQFSQYNTLNGYWYKTYGGDGLDCLKGLDLTDDECFIAAGETEVDGQKDGWIIKIDGNGDVIWELTYGAPDGADGLWPVITTSSGDYLVGGWYYNTDQGFRDALLIKTDQDGNIIWTHTYGGEKSDEFYSVLETIDGYLAVGTSSSYTPGNSNGFIMKVDFDGNELWVKPFEKEGFTTEVDSIIPANEGNGFLIAGGYFSSTQNSQGWLIKIDAEGNTLWDKTYGDVTLWDWSTFVASTNDNNYILTGGTGGGPYGKGYIGPNVWLLKVDNTGEILWEQNHGIPILKDYSLYVQPTSDGGYIFTGHTFGISGDACFGLWSKIWLVKTDGNGNIEWLKLMPGTGHGRTVLELDDGYIICGFEGPGPGHGTSSEYAVLIKTDEHGNIE